MNNRKFVKLLRTLNTAEQAAFRKYLKRRYVDEEVALGVFDYIWKFRPDFDNETKLDRDYAYARIFGAAAGQERRLEVKLNNALSDLHIWLKDFLLLERVRRDTPENRALWIAELRDRGLTADYNRQAVRHLADQIAAPKRDVADHLRTVAAHYRSYFLIDREKRARDTAMLPESAQALDACYALLRLKLATEMITANRVFGLAYDTAIPDCVLTFVQSIDDDEHPLLALYREVYLLTAGNPGADFERTLLLFSRYVDRLDKEELQELLSRLRTLLSRGLTKSNVAGWQRIHQINQMAVSGGILTLKGVITSNQFVNFVMQACNARDDVWAQWFIKTQNRYLLAETRDNTVAVANAIIQYEDRAFSEVLRTLKDRRFTEIHDALRAYPLKIRSLYELDHRDDDLAESCQNFSDLIGRRGARSMPVLLRGIQEFLRIVRLLVERKVEAAELLEAIGQAEQLSFKDWLLEKAAVYSPDPTARPPQ
jgi:hypothetical protein